MDNLLNNIIAIFTTLIALIFLFHKKIRVSETWHATVTPLASIIGSGFLVSAPLLLLATGQWAVFAMMLIVLIAYGLGDSLRFNIQHVEPLLKKAVQFPWTNRIEIISRPILGIAYIISVAFYLKLLSAFALRGINLANPFYENSLTTLLLLFIGIMGRIRGLSALEFLEIYSVNTKLAIISCLLITYSLYNIELATKSHWLLKIYAHESWWLGLRKILGMLIIIQGFETSRYLSDAYSASTRIRTMRYAQWISGVIYIIFVGLAMVVFNDIHQISATAVIDLSRIVAIVLPALLIIAAVMSQFSAAVADTVGSGGLLTEATRHKISVNNSYLFITLIAIILTWITNIYQIVTIASKAFALYYALQVILSIITIWNRRTTKHKIIKLMLYTSLLILMLLVIFIGIPVEET